jgi:hypothetical protein
LEIDLRAVDQLDDTGIDMPDLVWPGGADTDGGLGRMDALARTAPAMLTNELGPGCRGGEDLADALGITSKGAKRHVPVLGRQHHLLDGGHFVAGELARACPWARRSVGEVAGYLCSSPSMVAPRFEADDVQDGGQGKEGFGAGDGAKEPGLGLSFRETIFIEGEARSKTSRRRTTAASTRARLSQRALDSSATCLSWSNGSVVTTGRSPRCRQVETVERGM